MGQRLAGNLFKASLSMTYMLVVGGLALVIVGQLVAALLAMVFGISFACVAGWMVWLAAEAKWK